MPRLWQLELSEEQEACCSPSAVRGSGGRLPAPAPACWHRLLCVRPALAAGTAHQRRYPSPEKAAAGSAWGGSLSS